MLDTGRCLVRIEGYYTIGILSGLGSTRQLQVYQTAYG
jgi:hypothetical protein